MRVRYRNAAPLRYSKTLRLLSIVGGGLLAAVGLELFLMPHKLLPGGIAGLSALLSHVTEMRLGLFLFLFNLPFILMSRRQINLRFALYTMLGLICLTAGSLALHHFPAAISEPLPAAIAGAMSRVRTGHLCTLRRADRRKREAERPAAERRAAQIG